MAELAIADNVFLFLTESVVGSENFYQEEFYIRKVHNLVTDFLALMPMKVSCMCVFGWTITENFVHAIQISCSEPYNNFIKFRVFSKTSNTILLNAWTQKTCNCLK